MSVRPCCFNNPHPSSPLFHALSPPTDYQMAPLSSLNIYPLLSPITTSKISPTKIFLTSKSSPSPLTAPSPTPTQPSKHSSPLTINLDCVEIIFSTPPTSPHAFFDSFEVLPPRTINPPPPQQSFKSIECLANQSPLLPAMKPLLPPLLPHLLPLGPNKPFLMLTHEMFCDHCQRTQVIIENLRDEMPFILNHILDRLNVLAQNYYTKTLGIE
uniref:Uncharacterized protein n=1 Tax=Tanacetum cinerariifolium TaxID=118510 RepID=A0A6L2LX22_TANCI|nr:hypothetical protein [Tanacetum cinerariifolium]